MSELTLNLTKVDRTTALRTWMTYHRIRPKQLARDLGVNESFISYLIQGKRRSRKIITKLVERGFPAELLPEPGNGPGRPKA